MEENRQRKIIPNIEERSDLTAAAFTRLLEQIAKTKSATEQEALELLVKFALYWAEFNLIEEDLVAHRKADNPNHFDFHNPNMRGTYEMALVKARTGDFRGLKEVLSKEDVDSWQSITGFPDSFKNLLKLIPDEGKPIVFTKPAWMGELEYQQARKIT